MAIDTTFPPCIYKKSGGNTQVIRYPGGLLVSEDSLWGDCPLINYLLDPSIGVLIDEPFVSYDSSNDYTLTQATAGSAAISTTYPGALAIDAGDSTNHHGVNLQRLKAAIIPAASADIWAEFRVRIGTSLAGEFFLGLAASDTTIIATGAMSTNNRIGWTGVAGDGVMQFDCDKAGTGSQTTGVTLSTSAWKTLGFRYDGTLDTVQQYIDGVATGSAIATAKIPKAVIYPSFVCQSTGTAQPVLIIGGYRVFQLR